MTEIYSKRYNSVGEATNLHKVYREIFIPASALTGTLNTPLSAASFINDLTANFQGTTRQAFKILLMHDGGGGPPTLDVEIQEFVPEPSIVAPFGGIPPFTGQVAGRWATKSGLGVGSAAANTLFEHNSEDTMRWARILLTPRDLLPDVGIRIILSGRL